MPIGLGPIGGLESLEAMRLSDGGLAAVAAEESFVPFAYYCPARIPTIGYGHVLRGGEAFGRVSEAEARAALSRLPPGIVSRLVRDGGMLIGPLSEADALDLLRRDSAHAEGIVRACVRVPLEQHQFDALVSFAFNVGDGAFRGSTLLRLLNAGDYDGAAGQFSVWRMGGGRVLPVLVARRRREERRFRGLT